MKQKLRSILLFGAPGAGKGTQGKILGAIPGFVHLSTGDMFRSLDPKSELGQQFHAYSSKGELVPDELTVRLWADHVARLADTGRFRPEKDILVLDGIPRNPAQAGLLEPHIDPLCIVHLDSDDQQAMIERLRGRALKENRADDAKVDVIRRRLEVFRDETEPVLSCYPPALIARVDAIGAPAAVLQNILRVVAPLQREV